MSKKIVKIGKRTWEMEEKEAKGLLKIAKEKVPQGIYAVEHNNYIELHNEPMSITQMKRVRLEYKRQGMKVYCNGL